MSDIATEPRIWWAVLNRNRNRNAGTIAAKDRNVEYEQNVEHVFVIEYSAYAALKDLFDSAKSERCICAETNARNCPVHQNE